MKGSLHPVSCTWLGGSARNGCSNLRHRMRRSSSAWTQVSRKQVSRQSGMRTSDRKHDATFPPATHRPDYRTKLSEAAPNIPTPRCPPPKMRFHDRVSMKLTWTVLGAKGTQTPFRPGPACQNPYRSPAALPKPGHILLLLHTIHPQCLHGATLPLPAILSQGASPTKLDCKRGPWLGPDLGPPALQHTGT